MRAAGIPFTLAAVATSACMTTVAWGALNGQPVGWVAIGAALSFLPYGLLLGASLPQLPPLALSLLCAAVPGAVLVAAPSVLSDDLYRYLWDARLLLHGIDPYAFAPDDLRLTDLRDAHWARINHKAIPTIYPAGAQALFALAYLPTHSPLGPKLLALLLHLATVVLLHRCAQSPQFAGRGAGARAVYLYALNPLALLATALGGHLDVAVGLGVVALAWSLERGRLRAAVALAVGIAWLKLVGIVLAPLLALRSRRSAVIALALSLLALPPLLAAGHGGDAAASGLRQYGSRWQGNEGGFALLKGAASALLSLGAPAPDANLGPDEIELRALRPLLSVLRGGPLDPSPVANVPYKEPRPAGVFHRPYLASQLARAAGLVLVLVLVLVLLRQGAAPALALRLTLLSVLLLSPQLHPWYLLWLLPLECLLGRPTGLVWSAAVLVAYAPLALWQGQRLWLEPQHARLLQYGLVALALALELTLQRNHLRWRDVDPESGAV